ncbi:putative serine/threonine-protein kinase PknA [Rugosimonospora africana]|uniref:Putative serine/threonine-protein kinase PknA n=2 Tax=Rugosimonospora africana TaxID=556532 RepID=A0A8J3QT59_9ACTN|nr:putative serine/threonine-protein kinase PknA [Rugosimonospora africana]
MGTAIVGRYVLLGPIGYGGVSVVYQAIDTHRGKQSAVKLLAPAFAGDPRARMRVHQEAVITQRLRHPSVPKVYGFGDAPLPDGGCVPYVAMELLTGAVLAGKLAGGAMHWREAVRVAATIADVLAIAHRRGVVHRDLTPANIMMTRTGVKIIDFGEATTVEPISAMARAAEPLPTRTASVATSPADDVYALGVVLYQMLTGRSPYPSRGPDGDLAAARLRHVAPTPVLLVPQLPRALAEICRDCMAKRPEERPDSASVAVALWALLAPDAVLVPAGSPGTPEPFGRWRRPAPLRSRSQPSAQPGTPPTMQPDGQPGTPRDGQRPVRSPARSLRARFLPARFLTATPLPATPR